MQLVDLFAQLTQVDFLNCEEVLAIKECESKKWQNWRNICEVAKDDMMNCWLNDKSCGKLDEENGEQLNDVNESINLLIDELKNIIDEFLIGVIDAAEESNKDGSALFESELVTKQGHDTAWEKKDLAFYSKI